MAKYFILLCVLVAITFVASGKTFVAGSNGGNGGAVIRNGGNGGHGGSSDDGNGGNGGAVIRNGGNGGNGGSVHKSVQMDYVAHINVTTEGPLIYQFS